MRDLDKMKSGKIRTINVDELRDTLGGILAASIIFTITLGMCLYASSRYNLNELQRMLYLGFFVWEIFCLFGMVPLEDGNDDDFRMLASLVVLLPIEFTVIMMYYYIHQYNSLFMKSMVTFVGCISIAIFIILRKFIIGRYVVMSVKKLNDEGAENIEYYDHENISRWMP